MNNENLEPFYTQSGSEARERGRKGGIASGKARREKKALADALRAVLYHEDGNGEVLLDSIVRKCLENLLESASVRDLHTLQRILGEDIIKVDVMSDEEKTKVLRAEMASLYGVPEECSK